MTEQYQAPTRRVDPAGVLMATVDTLPQPYEVLGLVEASAWTESGVVETSGLMDLLAQEAVDMGADGVIGIRLSYMTLPGASKERFVGRITDHGHVVVGVAIGTAVRRLRTTGPWGATPPHPPRRPN